MKNHITVKFIAVFLCALSLLFTAGSAAGIIGFTAADLYEKNPGQLLTENLESRGQWFTNSLVKSYAEEVLGGCPEEMLESFDYFFNDGCYGYTLKDSEGNVLEAQQLRNWKRHYSYTISGEEYRKVLDVYPEDSRLTTYEDSDLVITDNLPLGGAEVYEIEVSYEGGNTGCGSEGGMGLLYYTSTGQVAFAVDGPEYYWMEQDPLIYHIAFYDVQGELLYEIRSPYGVGSFSRDDGGVLTFLSHSVAPKFQNRQTGSEEITVYDAVPERGAKVGSVSLHTESGSYGIGQDDLGYISREADGTVIFVSHTPFDFEQLGSDSIQSIAFFDNSGNLLYESSLRYGIGEINIRENNYWNFKSTYSAAATEIAATDATVPAADAYSNTKHTSYWDSSAQVWMEVDFVWEQMPEYTVELYLAEGAMDQEIYWDLLTRVWAYRNELFYVLGISLLIFAVTAVYLCCAAGKKPGTQELRPSGFNRLSLDLYLVAGGGAIFLILGFGIKVMDYLVRNSPGVLAPFALFAGFGACLIFVAFCFACAAQFKMPGGFWWKNTLFIRCFSLVGRILMKLVAFTEEKLEPMIDKFCKKLWTLTKRLWKGLLTILEFLFKKLFRFFDDTLDRFFRFLGRKIARFFSMLPLTWQWLLTGIVLLFVLFFSILTRSEGFMLLGICACLGIVVYGAHCFGILLESAKRMGKGDLETKVSDQFLLGSFKEFAGDLNALADVAVVAAQKQLRSERMKTELITNVSHDIKTPLTSIINYVDLLEKPHTQEEQAVYLEVLSRQSQQLKKLIEDLMEMSKASTGNMAVDIVCVNAAEAVNQALGEFADKLDKAQLIPVFRQPEETIYMKADGRLAWRVMSNLLSNAVKYALPGTRLYIDLVELENKVIISFKNISREELNVSADELLERFVRGDASRNTEGSGLGLNIAQSLMELQKGKLQLLVDGDLFKVTLVFPAVKE